MAGEISEWMEGLNAKNPNVAYEYLKLLEEESARSGAVYPYFDRFADMLDGPNAFVRMRGIRLICANAPWDEENKIDAILDKYLEHIADEKPIAARQCIQALPEITMHKPRLVDKIRLALENASFDTYADSMIPLLKKDVASALNRLGT